MIQLCKTEKPYKRLSILSSGKPSVSELNVVEKLMEHYDLNETVINFLLVYVIGQLEEFPSYNYFDKVAVSWQREGVTSISDALEVIKKRQIRRENQQSTKTKERNTIPNDIEADWFDEYIKNR